MNRKLDNGQSHDINTWMNGWRNGWIKGESDRQNGYIAKRVPLSIFNPLVKVLYLYSNIKSMQYL